MSLLRRLRVVCFVFLGLGLLGFYPQSSEAKVLSALTLGKAPQLSSDFQHFPYANPDAPKGGQLRLASIGTFDSFHPYVARGIPAAGIGLVNATLTTSSRDEPFTQYPYVASSFELVDGGATLLCHLNPRARFSDGHPVSAEDVVFSFDALMHKGSPMYRKYYAGIVRVTARDAHTVRFELADAKNPELPVVAAQLPVLPAHWWKGRDFSKPTLEQAPGCGPYVVKRSSTGYSVEYERVKDWWGADLPVNAGRFNFDRIRFDYYRDRTVAGEAFRSGEFDFQMVSSAKSWAEEYVGPAVDAGLLKREAIRHTRPSGMQGFVMNTRRPLFADRKVRQALGLAFDFEWTNRALFYGQYARCLSFFSNSEFASSGVPQGKELSLLEPYRSALPQELFVSPFTLSKSDGSGRIRPQLRKALTLLREAGWTLRDGVLRNAQGKSFEFEMLLRSPRMERVVLPYQKNLKRLGITMHVSLADSSRYIRRIRSYDYDMVVGVMRQSDSPGSEQRLFWTSSAAKTPGTRNLAGIQNPVVDGLVDKVIGAQNRDELLTAVHALDRVLLWEAYVVPGWYSPIDRIAYWDRFGMPKLRPSRGTDIFSWWFSPEGDARIQAAGFSGAQQ